MKESRKESKKFLKTLKFIINSYGGSTSLSCPSLIANILDELASFHFDITNDELEMARNRMNQIKPKN